MKFKSFGKKYSFQKDVLVRDFPAYLHSPIRDWLWNVLHDSRIGLLSTHYLNRGSKHISNGFLNELQILFREEFPQSWSEFYNFLYLESDRMSNFLALCLQNYADGIDAVELEGILSIGGSGYEVVKINKTAHEHEKGTHDLHDRVSSVVKSQSENALNDSDLLKEAWKYCYSRNPDYEKVVSRSCDFLEGFLGKIYFPKDPKPQLTKFVHAFESSPNKLSYKGSEIVDPKSNLTSLLKEASNIRGQHTEGKGRKPTKEEAEFTLHTTIYIWNLHQK